MLPYPCDSRGLAVGATAADLGSRRVPQVSPLEVLDLGAIIAIIATSLLGKSRRGLIEDLAPRHCIGTRRCQNWIPK